MNYRLWVNERRTIHVRIWDDGRIEVATRDDTWDIWGAPEQLIEEQAEQGPVSSGAPPMTPASQPFSPP